VRAAREDDTAFLRRVQARKRLADMEAGEKEAAVDRDLRAIRRQKKRLFDRGQGHASGRGRRFTTAACLRGDAGPQLQETVRMAVESGVISYNDRAVKEYRILTGAELR
jgi:hypothetical protein